VDLVVSVVVVVVGLVVDLLADLPGDLGGDVATDWHVDVLADLPGHVVGDLFGHLLAVVAGHVVTHLVGHCPDHLVAVGLGHLAALGVLNNLLVLDGNLLAHSVNLGLTPWSRCGGGGVWGRSGVAWLGLWLGLTLLLAVVWLPPGLGHLPGRSTDGGWSGGGGWDSGDGSGVEAGGVNSRGGGADDWAGLDGWAGVNGGNLGGGAVVTHHSSLLANLSLDVLALVDVSGLDDGVSLVDALLGVGGVAHLLRHLPHGGLALLLVDGVAVLVVLHADLGLGHRGALFLLHNLALLSRGDVVHRTTHWVRGVVNCVGPPWCWGWGKGRFVGCLVGCPPKAWASHEPVALVGGGVAGSAPKPSTPGCSPSSSGGSLRLGQSLPGHKDRQANKKLDHILVSRT